jgi:adenine-specific DNA methylase
MHKYFARRPWNVFSDLIAQCSSEGEIVLDPFCGGGVTVVEALKLRRKAVGVDANPIATYVTSMECKPVKLHELTSAFDELRLRVADELSSLYRTRCSECGGGAIADWFEWDERSRQILRVKLDCPLCGSLEQKASRADQALAKKIERNFEKSVGTRKLWFPNTQIPTGDKTGQLLTQGYVSFHELFTKRNLLALATLRKEILKSRNNAARELLLFVLSSSLKWASRQSHMRGKIVEGWAMHAFWIYPRSLEMNEWNVYNRRYQAVYRGKQYSNEHIGSYCKFTDSFADLLDGDATCLVLSGDAADLPIPQNSVDAIVTDPPYGGNVNYAELSDFWNVWVDDGRTIDKTNEVVINRTQEKSIDEYQKLLELVFAECYRVLKPGRWLVSTFNSKDFRVVTCFVVAASRAGFTFVREGVRYQAPIRAYTTTFHAMQIGAFVGDFIFTFRKEAKQPRIVFEEDEWRKIQATISNLVEENVESGRAEPNLREQAYEILIPFLVKYAVANPVQCRRAADFFELKVRRNDAYFKKTRRRMIERRRRYFTNSKRS